MEYGRFDLALWRKEESENDGWIQEEKRKEFM